MASVKVVFRKDKLNKKGKAPIHFRIIKHRRIRYISSGIMLDAKYWSEKKNRIKPSHPNSMRFNSYLLNKIAELQDQIYEFETRDKSLTTAKLKEKILGKAPVDFFEFAEEILSEYLSAGQIGTYDKNKSILKKLKTYQNGKRLDFQDISIRYLTKYEKYLREVKKNHTNTIHNNMKFIRKVFNEAIRQDQIDRNNNPFDYYEMKTQKTSRSYLTEQEVAQFENVALYKGSNKELHRDMFIFACYVGGLRISDVLQLEWDNYDGVHVHVTTRKTGAQLSIKCPTKARKIIEWYRESKLSDRFIFPVLSDDLDKSDLKYLDQRISTATAKINKSLKSIAKEARITKKISFHVSRHTWATRALTKGMTIDKVSKLMGHASIKETQVYAKIVGKSLDEAMDLFE